MEEEEDLDMTLKRNSTLTNLNEEKIKAKLAKFARGKAAKDGKLMKDDDDEKDEDLQ